MKKTLLFAIALFMVCISQAQIDFRKGYIVSNTGDTIMGLLNYGDGVRNYSACRFKTTDRSEPKTYTPADIRAYRFDNDKIYISKKIKNADGIEALVFLEGLVSGRASLYRYYDDFYIVKSDTIQYQLTNTVKETTIDGKRVLKPTNRHIGLLSHLFSDCKSIQNKVQQTQLSERSLTETVEAYNRCVSASGITYKASKRWSQVDLGFAAGLNTSSLQFTSDRSLVYDHLTEDFDRALAPFFGLSFNFSLPRLSERVSLQADLYFSSITYNSNSTRQNSGYYVVDNVDIELKNLMIPLGIRYTFLEKKITPYFIVGVSNVYHLSSKSFWKREVVFPTSTTTYENEALEMKGGQFGLWGAFGANKALSDKWNGFIELRVATTNGVVSPSMSGNRLSSSILNLEVVIGLTR